MKAFSKKWKASKRRAKQRKYHYNAPHHLKQKMIASPLSKDLKEKHARNALPIRVEDTVEIMRGSHKGRTGKVSGFSPKNRRMVYIQGFEVQRRDGSKKPYPFHHSNLMITAAARDERRTERTRDEPEPREPKTTKPTAKKTAKRAVKKRTKK